VSLEYGAIVLRLDSNIIVLVEILVSRAIVGINSEVGWRSKANVAESSDLVLVREALAKVVRLAVAGGAVIARWAVASRAALGTCILVGVRIAFKECIRVPVAHNAKREIRVLAATRRVRIDAGRILTSAVELLPGIRIVKNIAPVTVTATGSKLVGTRNSDNQRKHNKNRLHFS